MDETRRQQIAQAIATLGEDDMTMDGKPGVDAINDAMPETAETVTAAERDEVWTIIDGDGDGEAEADAADMAEAGDPATTHDATIGGPMGQASTVETDSVSPATDGGATRHIRLLSAQSDPLTGYVHGIGAYRLRVGETHEVRTEVLEAITTSGAIWENDNG